VYREGAQNDQNPVLAEKSFRDGTIDHMENFFACVKSRKEPNAPSKPGSPPLAQAHRQPGLPARRPDRMAAEELNSESVS